jgi:CRP-like cAMP-binding protein
LLRKLKAHSVLASEDEAALRGLPYRLREIGPDEDIVREGDMPQVSIAVIEGEVARYHSLYGGKRQYLSFHLAGDWPDAQTLFFERLDHAVCALNQGATVAVLQHDHLRAAIARCPSLAYAVWRETLMDAAIFRSAITNNSARGVRARMAHFFCEIFLRASRAALVHERSTSLPIRQSQLGETLGMALVTVNRTLRNLRRTGAVDFRDGRLRVMDWQALTTIAEFDPEYLNYRGAPPQ